MNRREMIKAGAAVASSVALVGGISLGKETTENKFVYYKSTIDIESRSNGIGLACINGSVAKWNIRPSKCKHFVVENF